MVTKCLYKGCTAPNREHDSDGYKSSHSFAWRKLCYDHYAEFKYGCNPDRIYCSNEYTSDWGFYVATLCISLELSYKIIEDWAVSHDEH